MAWGCGGVGVCGRCDAACDGIYAPDEHADMVVGRRACPFETSATGGD